VYKRQADVRCGFAVSNTKDPTVFSRRTASSHFCRSPVRSSTGAARRSIGIKALRPLQFTGSVFVGYERRGCLISSRHAKKRELTTVDDVEFFGSSSPASEVGFAARWRAIIIVLLKR